MADNNGGMNNEGGVKTFTQDEVNALIGKRVNEVSSKYADYEALKEKAGKYDEIQESSKTELQKANERAAALQKQIDEYTKRDAVREVREKVSKETSVPIELLTGDTEEACKKQAEAIVKFAKPRSYPGPQSNKNSKKSGGSDDNTESMREWARALFGN